MAYEIVQVGKAFAFVLYGRSGARIGRSADYSTRALAEAEAERICNTANNTRAQYEAQCASL